MAKEPRRTRSNIIRITHEINGQDDEKTGGGYKKMFPGVKERLMFVAHQLDTAAEEYNSVYPIHTSAGPYLVFQLQPKAIAKSHSALNVLNKCGLEVVASRTLEEKIVHGIEGSFDRLGSSLIAAAEIAPTDEDIQMLDREEKGRRKKKQDGEKGKKSEKSIRRNLPGKDFTWNDVAQLSTLRNVDFIHPEEKLSVPSNFEAGPVFVSTFPFCSQTGDDVAKWLTGLERLAAPGKTGIRVVRTNQKLMEEIRGRAAGLGKMWNLDVNLDYPRNINSMVFLIETASAEMLQDLVRLDFVSAVEIGMMRAEVSERPAGMAVPAGSTRALPVAGVVDTGIVSPSKLDPYISYRGGDETVRNKGDRHATDVAYLLVQDGTATPWNPDVAGTPCAIRDIARIDGGPIDGKQLRTAIWEATRDGEGEEGTVNFSGNAEETKRVLPRPKVTVFGELLDHLSLDAENLMIVCSAGNSGSVGMDSPADGVHVMSVGAFTRTPQGDFVRSDYSCHGGGIAHNVKPTFVVPVHDKNHTDPVWDTLVPSRSPGTSFAAPVATRVHAGLAHRGFDRDEALALMVHHAKHPGKDVFYRPSSKEIEEFGFGVVPSIPECDPADGARVTLLYNASVVKGKYYELRLPIPPELSNYSAFARLSAYTRALCSREMGEEYVSVEVPIRLRMFKKDSKNKGQQHVDLPPEPVDWKARYEEHRIRYGWKWGTLRRYSKTIRFEKYKSFALRIGPVIWRSWAQEAQVTKPIRVQCVLSFYPLEEGAPPFFDFFHRALLREKIEIELPLEARIKLEGEI